MSEECIVLGQQDADRFERARRVRWLDIEAVSKKKVLMVGAGAIGNEVAKNLVLSGFKDITVLDMDRVVTSNLARCLFFSDADAVSGRLKASIVADGMKKLDPGVEALAITERIQDMDDDFIGGFDLALGCLDNILARLHVNAQCCHYRIPYIDGAMDGLRGKVQVVLPPETPCLECGMNRSHGRIVDQRFSCTGNDISVFVPKIGAEITTTSVVAAVQVREAVKACCGQADKCIRNLAYYDGLNNSFDIMEIEINPDCVNHPKNPGTSG